MTSTLMILFRLEHDTITMPDRLDEFDSELIYESRSQSLSSTQNLNICADHSRMKARVRQANSSDSPELPEYLAASEMLRILTRRSR